jgi:hypothetical protein
MNILKTILVLCFILCIQSCYETGDIQVQNDISNVKITDVEWGSFLVAYELLPGERSSRITIDKYSETLPSSHKISFKMKAKNRTIYLETVEKFRLSQDDYLLIVLDNETEVLNPND